MSTFDAFKTEADLHPVDSNVHKLLMWAYMQLQDNAAQIAELNEDDTSRSNENDQLRESLLTIKHALTVVAEYAGTQGFSLGKANTTFARDFAPFINIMNHHSDPDYGKPGNPKPHIDTRKKSSDYKI